LQVPRLGAVPSGSTKNMPRKNQKKYNAYVMDIVRARRALWFLENGPCRHCLSFEDLEVDHIDPKTKVSHNVWTWAEARRVNELSKCQVLCNSCHKIKTAGENRITNSRPLPHGTAAGYRRLCRCAPCKKAYSTVRKKRWKIKKA
jgi:5-methylcytosine-specific restriction endonuclease McrA